MMRMRKAPVSLSKGLVLLCLLLMGCAVAAIEEKAEERIEREKPLVFPPYQGPKKLVAVLPLGLSKKAAERYPQLVSRGIGFGVHGMIVNSLAETNRFRFVEIEKEVIEELVRQWWIGLSDLADPKTALKAGRLKQPSVVIYGEVFDFGVGRKEQVIGLQAKTSHITRIGIQVRYVDPETAEYVPASGIGESTSTTERVFVFGPQDPFDQTTIGRASQEAIHRAVLNLIQRLE